MDLRSGAKDGGQLHRNPSAIKNKVKRQAVYAKLKSAKATERRTRREENKRKATEAGELGVEAPRKKQKTIESEREIDPTYVSPNDLEVRTCTHTSRVHGVAPRHTTATTASPASIANL